MQQLDQYKIPFSIKKNGVAVRNTDVDEMIIQIGKVAKKYSTGELIYDNYIWKYPMTQEESMQLSGYTVCQAQFAIGDDIFNTPVSRINVKASIIGGSDE